MHTVLLQYLCENNYHYLISKKGYQKIIIGPEYNVKSETLNKHFKKCTIGSPLLKGKKKILVRSWDDITSIIFWVLSCGI